jgi:hypothetical protein
MATPDCSSPNFSTHETQNESNRLAHRIATLAAGGTIESVCSVKRIGRSKWFNVKVGVQRIDKADVALAVPYLEMQGLLERHPSDQNLVRVRSARKTGP